MACAGRRALFSPESPLIAYMVLLIAARSNLRNHAAGYRSRPRAKMARTAAIRKMWRLAIPFSKGGEK